MPEVSIEEASPSMLWLFRAIMGSRHSCMMKKCSLSFAGKHTRKGSCFLSAPEPYCVVRPVFSEDGRRQHTGLRGPCCLAMARSSRMQGWLHMATSSVLLA